MENKEIKETIVEGALHNANEKPTLMTIIGIVFLLIGVLGIWKFFELLITLFKFIF